MKSRRAFFITFFIVFLSRVPFLDAGYGVDRDAWRVACVARWSATTGEYVASRLPGYPLPELTYSLLWGNGAWMWNAVTALLSAVGAGLLALIGKQYGCKEYITVAVAYALTPVVFINSTTSMDYLWAVTFILASWYAGIFQQVWIAGFFIGIAAGCRITSLFILVPMALMLSSGQMRQKGFQRILVLVLVAVVTTAIEFFPIIRKYGIHFLTFSLPGYTPVTIILKTAILDVWGVLGALALASMGVLFILKYIKKDHIDFFPTNSLHIAGVAGMLVIVLYVLLFLRLPMEAGYLIPIIPFFYLFMAQVFSRKLFRYFAIFVIASAFLIGIDSADRPWSPQPSPFSSLMKYGERTMLIDWFHGPVFIEQEKRIQHMRFAERVIAVGDTLSERCVIVSGGWMPYFIFATPNAVPDDTEDYVLTRGRVDYTSLLSFDQFRKYQQQRIKIYYLVSADQYCRDIVGLDIAQSGAKVLRVD